MRLTTKSEYSLLALLFIARKGGESVKIEEICTYYDIPKKYLEALLTVLKQNRLIKARRGAKGGYSLAKMPEEISLAEIIRLLDGALAPTESVSQYFFSPTPLAKEQGILEIFRDIRNYISTKLENITLRDLL